MMVGMVRHLMARFLLRSVCLFDSRGRVLLRLYGPVGPQEPRGGVEAVSEQNPALAGKGQWLAG